MSPGAMGGYTGVDGSPQENFGQADMLAGPSNVPVVYTEEPTQPTEGPAPEGPATGGLDPTDAGLYRTQFKEGTLEIPLGTLDSRTYNTYLNDLIERTGDINEAEKLLNATLSILVLLKICDDLLMQELELVLEEKDIDMVVQQEHF